MGCHQEQSGKHIQTKEEEYSIAHYGKRVGSLRVEYSIGDYWTERQHITQLSSSFGSIHSSGQ
jgi:hypothetical protein